MPSVFLPLYAGRYFFAFCATQFWCVFWCEYPTRETTFTEDVNIEDFVFISTDETEGETMLQNK